MNPTLETVYAHIWLNDIEAGERMNCDKCPVVRAMRRNHPEIHHVQVAAYDIFVQWTPEGPRKQYSLLQEAVDFIESFDMGDSVKPCRIAVFQH